MGKAAILFVLVLALAGSFAADHGQTPVLATAATISVDESGAISVTHGEMQKLEINLSVPISNLYQQVQSEDAVLADSEGNPYIRIYEEKPGSPYYYSKAIGVQTSERTTGALPSSYIVPPEYAEFYAPTSRTESQDPQIRELALRITENATEPFEKVALLAIWVNRHISYDAGLVGQENGASWTLANRRGVCVEYSTLFAALARSINIPAKYVVGYAYSEKFGSWLGHAWNEAYIGSWVPVDSTWMEVGALDALHIEEAKYTELEKKFALTAYVSPPDAQIIWDTIDRSGALAGNIRTEKAIYAPVWANFELAPVEPKLAPGGKTLVYLKIDGFDYRVVPVQLATCSGEESITVADPEKYLILRPGQTSVAVWEVQASRDLPKNFVYTCPLTLNSPILDHREAVLTVDPRIYPMPEYSASLENRNLQAGGEGSVVLSLPAEGRGRDYYVLTEGGIFAKKVDAAADSIGFVAKRATGTQQLYVAGEGGGFYRLEYEIGANNTVSIDEFRIDGGLVENTPSTAQITISAQSYPAEVELAFSIGSQSRKFSGVINAPTDYEVAFTPKTAGSSRATLTASTGGAVDEKNIVVAVAEQPQEEPETASERQNEAPSPSPAQQGQNPCPLPLAVLTVVFAAIAIRR